MNLLKDKECFVNIYFETKEDTAWAKRGHIVAFEQIELAKAMLKISEGVNSDKLVVSDKDKIICVKNELISAEISKETGFITKLNINDREVIKANTTYKQEFIIK